MQVTVSRWGNSLALRIPKDLASRFRIAEGGRVELEARGDELVISHPSPRWSLDEMLAGIDAEALRDAFDWGPDAGRETVD